MDKALLQAAVGAGFGLAMGAEGHPFDKPDAETPWAFVWIIPTLNGVRAVTCGDAGYDEHVGILQIDFNYPMNRGPAASRAMLDVGADHFRIGRHFIRGVADVTIQSTSRIRGREVDGWWRVSLSIAWSARVPRDGTGNVVIPGGPDVEQDYEHIQLSPLLQWTINHNLGRKVTTDVYTAGGLKIIAEVANTSNNQVIVTFDTPMAGYAIIN